MQMSHYKQEVAQKGKVSPFVFPLLIKLASLCKLSFIVGSWCAFFSGTSIIAPLTGAFSGISGTFLVLGVSILAKLVWGTTFTFKFLACIVPGFFASLYWSTHSVLIRALLPLICMAAFIAHPAIGVGWVYSLYWLIPVALYFKKRHTLFTQALGSTFTAHAVGSVIWLYADAMTPETWLALMPVVLIERLTFAIGMVLAYRAIAYAARKWGALSIQKEVSCGFTK